MSAHIPRITAITTAPACNDACARWVTGMALRARWYWGVLVSPWLWDDWPHWRALGMCETGLNWSHSTAHFTGAYGFARTTWTAWNRASGWNFSWAAAEFAPPWAQTRIAQYGRSVGGYWGCDR